MSGEGQEGGQTETEQRNPPPPGNVVSRDDYVAFRDRMNSGSGIPKAETNQSETGSNEQGHGGRDTPDVDTGSTVKQPGEGSAPESPDAGDGEGEGGDSGDGEQPEAGKLPKGIVSRLARQQRKHDKETRELKAKIAELEGKSSESQSVERKPETAPGDVAGGDKAKAEPASQYEAVGLDDEGPRMEDYPNQTEWGVDYLHWVDEEPLEHHPKLSDIKDKAETPSKADEAGRKQPESKTPEQKPDERTDVQKRWDFNWDTINEVFLGDESGENDDVFDKFVDKVTQGRVPLDMDMLEHIATSEDLVAIVKEFTDNPVKARRIYANQRRDKGELIDAMLEKTRANSDKADDAKDTSPEIVPPLPKGTASHAPGRSGYTSDMSQAQYEAKRAKEMAEQSDGFFYRGRN